MTESLFVQHVQRATACSSTETRDHAGYLGETPIAWLAPRLRRGDEVLWHGRIATLDDLAMLETLWSDLGGVRSTATKFLVSDIYTTLHRPECTDNSSRQTIDRYLAMLRSGEHLDLHVTVRLDLSNGGLIERIYDGNKRCGALFEFRRNDVDRMLNLGVFVVAPSKLMTLTMSAP